MCMSSVLFGWLQDARLDLQRETSCANAPDERA
jgi:hypothetical protein